MDKKKLFRLVNTHFDLEEFKSLCFELEVDFDSLVGNGKEGKIRGLVSFLERRGQLDSLVKQLRSTRPQIAEFEALTVHNQNNLPFQEADALDWIDMTYSYSDNFSTGEAFRLRMTKRNQSAVVVVSQLLNTSLSLMNVVEYVATDILKRFQLHQDLVIFIEHYPPGYLSDGRETYELVQFNWEETKFSQPRWCPLLKTQAESLLKHEL